MLLHIHDRQQPFLMSTGNRQFVLIKERIRNQMKCGLGESRRGVSIIRKQSQIPCAAQILDVRHRKHTFTAHGKLVIRQKVQPAQFLIQFHQLRIRPLVVLQSFPHRLKCYAKHGNPHQMRNQKRLGAYRVNQTQHQLHIIQRLVTLAVLRFRDGPKLKHPAATFYRRQMWQQDGCWKITVVIQRESRIR